MGEISKKDFSNGKIYCIRNYLTDDIYIGSTTQPLSKRMDRHRTAVKIEKKNKAPLYQKMIEIGVEHFYIQLVKKFPCNDIEELRAEEANHIRELGNLNIRIDGRTNQQYYLDNKERINKQNQENYFNNRDERLKQQKEYNDNHKEHKREYDKQRREEKREELSEQHKAKYQNKKEHYKQKSSENYFKNKETIREKMNVKCTCECGVVYSYGNRLRHFKSKTHQNYLNNNIDNVQVSQEEQENRKQSTSSEVIVKL